MGRYILVMSLAGNAHLINLSVHHVTPEDVRSYLAIMSFDLSSTDVATVGR